MIKLCWSTLVRHNVTRVSLFQFLVPQLHPKGRERCKSRLEERRDAALPALLAAASLQKAFATSSHPSASVQTSEGLSDGKNSASRLLFSHPVFNNTLLETPFPGSSNSLQLLLGFRSPSLQKTCSLCWFCQGLTNCKATSLNTHIFSPTKHICSLSSSSVWVESSANGAGHRKGLQN